jgi:hypothetical protein
LVHLRQWHPNVQNYVESLTADESSISRPRSFRYTGAFVADLHRVLLSGGIFFYPGNREHPMGKLRLLYECAPLALLVEQAGGSASDGQRRILDIETQDIHQRTPIAIGSVEDVASFETFFKQDRAVLWNAFFPKAIKHAARFQRSPDANALIYKWALTPEGITKNRKPAGAEKMLSPFKSGGLRKKEYAKDVLFS